MAMTIKPGGDPALLDATAREKNKRVRWKSRTTEDGDFWEIYDPETGAVAATADTLQECGTAFSNLKVYGHIQPFNTAKAN